MVRAFISLAPTLQCGSRPGRSGVMEPWPPELLHRHSRAGAWERVRSCLLAIGIATVGLAPAAAADFAQGDYVTPGSKAAGLGNCVRETAFMRRNHMELIEHQRDVTVHQGIRSTTDSLAGCIDCHVGYDQQGQAVPVYADGQFCETCHEFVAVRLNCFDCHSGVPVHPSTEMGDPIRTGGGQKVGLSTGRSEKVDGMRDVKQGVGE